MTNQAMAAMNNGGGAGYTLEDAIELDAADAVLVHKPTHAGAAVPSVVERRAQVEEEGTRTTVWPGLGMPRRDEVDLADNVANPRNGAWKLTTVGFRMTQEAHKGFHGS